MMSLFRRRLPLYFAVLLPLFCAAVLQAAPQQPTRQLGRQGHKARLRDIQMGLTEATRLLREDPQKALDVLKALNDTYPRQEIVMVRLGLMYQSVGESDSARVMFQRTLGINPTNLEAGRSLILLHYSSGEEEQAEALSDRLLKNNHYSMGAYRTVGEVLMESGNYDGALELFRGGRTRSEGHYQLTLQIADLEQTMGNDGEALNEYLNYVEHFPQNYKVAKVKVVELFREDGAESVAPGAAAGAAEPAGKLLAQAERRAEASQPAHREMMDILSSVYLSLGLLEKSLAAALEADHNQLEDGETLRSLASALRSRYAAARQQDKLRYFDLSVRALEAYIERHPRSLHIPSEEFHSAALYADAGSGLVPGLSGTERGTFLEKAIGDLDRISKKYPGSEEAALADLKKGDLIFEVRRRPKDALAVYEQGLRTAGGNRRAFVQRIGMVHIALGEYDLALTHFQRYIRTDNELLRESGIYYTGVIFGFTGKYEAARDTLTALARENPASPYTNDAIELAWIIEEGRKKDETLLKVYLESVKAELAFDTSGVVADLKEIVKQGPGAALRTRALFRLGEVYAQMGDYDNAMDCLQQFLIDYPEDDLVPDVHRAIARVYEYGYGDKQLALEEYKHILLMYPGYLYLDEVRKDIGRLQPEGTVN